MDQTRPDPRPRPDVLAAADVPSTSDVERRALDALAAALDDLGRLDRQTSPAVIDRIFEASAQELPQRLRLRSAPAPFGERATGARGAVPARLAPVPGPGWLGSGWRRIGPGLAMAAAIGFALVPAMPLATALLAPDRHRAESADALVRLGAPEGARLHAPASAAEPVLATLLQQSSADAGGDQLWPMAVLLPISNEFTESTEFIEVSSILETRDARFADLAAEMAQIKREATSGRPF